MKLTERCVLENDCELWEKIVIEEFYKKYNIFPVLYNDRVENHFAITKKMNLIDIKYWFGYRGMGLGYFKSGLFHTSWITRDKNNDFILTIHRAEETINNKEIYKMYKKQLENRNESL